MIDRRERQDDTVESQRAALDGRQAEMWTALPGIIESFDPAAMTVAVQPAIAGRQTNEKGKAFSVTMPLLPDVPVVFPCGGGFTLTFPIKPGDECLVVFASRCIDAWWQNGGVGEPIDPRMHDLSDGFALVGVRSQARKLSPAVDTANAQLRADDGKTVVELTPDSRVMVTGPAAIELKSETVITLTAPVIHVIGRMQITEDAVADGISLKNHTHQGDSGGTTGAPQ